MDCVEQAMFDKKPVPAKFPPRFATCLACSNPSRDSADLAEEYFYRLTVLTPFRHTATEIPNPTINAPPTAAAGAVADPDNHNAAVLNAGPALMPMPMNAS